jgi:hypothetical protein
MDDRLPYRAVGQVPGCGSAKNGKRGLTAITGAMLISNLVPILYGLLMTTRVPANQVCQNRMEKKIHHLQKKSALTDDMQDLWQEAANDIAQSRFILIGVLYIGFFILEGFDLA